MFVSRFCAVIVSLIILPLFAYSGDIDSPAAPTDTGSAMYTLTDIYNRLNEGTTTAKRTGAFTEPADGPDTATGRTLNEIMAIAPSKDDTDGASASHVLSGKIFWGLTTAGWGTQTGNIATRTLSADSTTVNAGYYGTTTLTAVDADLASGNIKSGVTIFGIEGSASSGSSAGVEKTGAGDIIGYTEAAGEDGTLQKGVAWPSPRFADNGNGTVTDNLTGLIWLKNANVANAKRSWSQALSDVVQLNTNGTMNGNSAGDTSNGGGHQTDWRLPNVKELHSLIHFGFYNPALSNTTGTGQWTEGSGPFTNVVSDRFWSGTTYSSTSTYAWCVSLYNGFISDYSKTSETGKSYVWPVRGGE